MTSHSLSQHPSQIITYPANKEIKPPKQSSVCQNPSIKTLTPRSTQALPKLICLVWSSYLLFLCFKFTFESIFMSIWIQAYYACSKLVSTYIKGLGHSLLACAALTCSQVVRALLCLYLLDLVQPMRVLIQIGQQEANMHSCHAS